MSDANSDSRTRTRLDARAARLAQTAHQPWPVPRGRWLVGQSWLYLLFIHWPIAYDDLRRLVPEELEPDTFDDRCWPGVVPFRMRTVRFAGCPPVARYFELPRT